MQHGDDDGPGDLIWVALGAPVLLAMGGGAVVVAWWGNVIGWLVEHRVVVAASAAPIVELPHAGGAGLDWFRLVVAGAAIAMLFVVAGSGLKHRYDRAQGRTE